MYNFAKDYLYFIITCMICIDQGDGHWKEKDKESLRHDIELYKNMAEQIEREIESFYDKYPEERYKEEHINRIYYKHVTNTVNHQKETGKYDAKDPVDNKIIDSNLNNITDSFLPKHDINEENVVKVTFKNNQPEKLNILKSPWPKFEDIVLAMGKKYDWKNDRWIKMKGKLKKSEVTKNSIEGDNNSIEFHEKHKFSYRIVKLSKSKSRRNVVVAVSAVR